MPLMRKSSSTAPAGVTQTGQPGPEISRIFCGSRDFRPAFAIAMVWVVMAVSVILLDALWLRVMLLIICAVVTIHLLTIGRRKDEV